MEKNKVFIFNYWWNCDNYGAILTGFALNSIVNNSFLVDTLRTHIYRKENKKYTFSNPFKKKYMKTLELNGNYEKLVSLNLEAKAFITGSDQVFRIGIHRQNVFEYMLDFAVPESKKIAFSASFGFDKEGVLEECDNETLEWAKSSLKSFDFISVREKSGVEICRDLFDVEAEWIIDPVFILEKEKYNKLIEDSTVDYKNKIVAYVLDTNKEYKNALKYLSKKYNKKVIETANSNISIENWLASIRDCDLFITDSFHGMCFALIFNKPFICLANKDRGKTRFDSICEMLGVENQCIDSISDVMQRDCVFKVDYEVVNQRISKECQRGLDFLNKALEAPIKITQEKMDARTRFLENRVCELMKRDNLSYQLKKYMWRKWTKIYQTYLPRPIQKTIGFFWHLIKNRSKNNVG